MPPKRKAKEISKDKDDSDSSEEGISNDATTKLEPERYRYADLMDNSEDQDRYLDDNDLLDVEDVMVEPTPLEKRLRENGRYNQGDWSSEELKKLHDSITSYGTTSKALSYISGILGTRSTEEVEMKINEIREMVGEHRVERLSDEVTKWTTLGYKNIHAPAKLHFVEKSGKAVNGWPAAIARIDKMRKGLDPSVMSKIIAKNFHKFAPKDKMEVQITKSAMSPHFEKTAELNWDKITDYMKKLFSGSTKLPAINAIESAVILSVMDEIEREADYIPENYRAVIKGLLGNIQINDLRDFEPDIPCSELTAAQIVFDPLKTRSNGFPEGGIAITQDFINRSSKEQQLMEIEPDGTVCETEDISRVETPEPTIENL
ncbi:unnamed protein product [Auanema sp. JU1783]|nr:unnamed protein product [Auanema sp. JU1783]